jgi:hypothetical protein
MHLFRLIGRESPHYRDQLPLYVQWRYKPMPMTLAEARAVGVSETVLRGRRLARAPRQ